MPFHQLRELINATTEKQLGVYLKSNKKFNEVSKAVHGNREMS